MPILPPGLDDRRFDDLVEDLIARIPAHTPEWTNPRLGDPGPHADRAVRVARRHAALSRQPDSRAAAAGVPLAARLGLKPARAATGIVSLVLRAADRARARSRCGPGARVNGPVPFETLGETTVLPISGEAYIKRTLTEAEATQAGELIAGLARIHRISGAAKGYQTMPVFDAGRAEPTASTSSRRAPTTRCGSRCSRPKRRGRTSSRPSTTRCAPRSAAATPARPRCISIGVVPALKIPEAFEEVLRAAPVPVHVGDHHARAHAASRPTT